MSVRLNYSESEHLKNQLHNGGAVERKEPPHRPAPPRRGRRPAGPPPKRSAHTLPIRARIFASPVRLAHAGHAKTPKAPRPPPGKRLQRAHSDRRPPPPSQGRLPSSPTRAMSSPRQVSSPPRQVSSPPRQVSSPPRQMSSPPRQLSSPTRLPLSSSLRKLPSPFQKLPRQTPSPTPKTNGVGKRQLRTLTPIQRTPPRTPPSLSKPTSGLVKPPKPAKPHRFVSATLPAPSKRPPPSQANRPKTHLNIGADLLELFQKPPKPTKPTKPTKPARPSKPVRPTKSSNTFSCFSATLPSPKHKVSRSFSISATVPASLPRPKISTSRLPIKRDRHKSPPSSPNASMLMPGSPPSSTYIPRTRASECVYSSNRRKLSQPSSPRERPSLYIPGTPDHSPIITRPKSPTGFEPLSLLRIVNSVRSHSTEKTKNRSQTSGTLNLLQDNSQIIRRFFSVDFRPPWDFSNDVCQVFRRRAAMLSLHLKHPTPRRVAFPACYSNHALPRELYMKKSFTCLVRLPVEADQVTTRIKGRLDETTGNDAIIQALKKVNNSKDPSTWVLKAVGEEEYIFGDDVLSDFEYVRNNLRNGIEVELTLVSRPTRDDEIEEARAQLKEKREKFIPYEGYFGREFDPLEHEEDHLTLDEDFETWKKIPMHELNYPFRIKIVGLGGIDRFPRNDGTLNSMFVKLSIFSSNQLISEHPLHTTPSSLEHDPVWGEWLIHSSVLISQLPRETLLCFQVFGVSEEKGVVLLGWVNQYLIDHRNTICQGKYCWPLWKLQPDEQEDEFSLMTRGTSRPNLSDSTVNAVRLYVEFNSFPMDVVAPRTSYTPDIDMEEQKVGDSIDISKFSKDQRKFLTEKLELIDPLQDLTGQQKRLIWRARHNLTKNYKALPLFLRAVNWTNRADAAEARRMLKEWTPPTDPNFVLELLDAQFSDLAVREYAVSVLRTMHDCQLQEILLQLTQCLKYEQDHFSALSQFLIERALSNPVQIGHFLFWHFQAEMHNPSFCERYGLLIEEYLLHCGKHATELVQQQDMIEQLLEIADLIAKTKDSEGVDTRPQTLIDKLRLLNTKLPSDFSLALNPKWRGKKLIVEKCTFMSSKKVPLWLAFENIDENADPILIIFKSGDDLRQDLLTLQLLRIMDQMWMSESLDMRMKPYTCVATGVNPDGEGVGMIQIVLNSKTINSIQKEFGGQNFGALKNTPLKDYLAQFNKGEIIYQRALDNFLRSCAGYCVATYVLGIGDRHSDNIMLTQFGHLFHIDFGHFLGNFKTKANFKRERSPFVFTPEMAYVMGGQSSDDYRTFLQHCCASYNVLRKFHRILIVLFLLMQSAGMPELSCAEDIVYLRNLLHLEISEEKAAKQFKQEVKGSLGDTYRRLDNTIHMWKHRK